ncbi:hypothetical protein A2U01_0015331, partial [Trifolium medium]|nr:hypothetical protein [Trifolium medium]
MITLPWAKIGLAVQHIPTAQIHNPILLSNIPPISQLPPLLPTPQSNLPVCNLPAAELRDRRSKGLCFKCDEKWNPSHRCQNKVLILMGEDEDEPPPDSDDPSTDDVSGDISNLHSLSSQLQSRSLRFSGIYNHHNFNILIDSGSTHNFVKPALVERLGLPITSCPRFKVATGCGTFLVCQFCCHGVSLMLQGIPFVVDLFILDIEGPDVVLGFPWLQSLGKVTHDYSTLTMEFSWQGTQVTLVGDTSIASQLVSLHQLQALIHTSDIAHIFTITYAPHAHPPSPESSIQFPDNLPDPLMKLLRQFESIFAAPTGLPPHRVVDHRIHLVEGSKPVNVR